MRAHTTVTTQCPPPLVAVAHGSRDPRSATTVRALVELVRAGMPHVLVRTAFLDLSDPSLPDLLIELQRKDIGTSWWFRCCSATPITHAWTYRGSWLDSPTDSRTFR